MAIEYDENRKALSELVLGKESFTEKELTEEFTRLRPGRTEIRRRQKIRDYLDDLREFGVLRLQGRVYYAQEWPSVLD